MEISILIPVFNEVKTILTVIDRVRAQPFETEIIIVDDGSQDGTRDLLRSTELPPNVKVLFHERNQGKGAALRTGIASVTKPITIIQDADLEYNPEDYKVLLK